MFRQNHCFALEKGPFEHFLWPVNLSQQHFFHLKISKENFFTTSGDICGAKSAIFFSSKLVQKPLFEHFSKTLFGNHFAVFFPTIHCQCSFFSAIFYFVCIFVCFQDGFADLDCPELQIGTALGQCRFVYGASDSFAPKVVSFHLYVDSGCLYAIFDLWTPFVSTWLPPCHQYCGIFMQFIAQNSCFLALFYLFMYFWLLSGWIAFDQLDLTVWRMTHPCIRIFTSRWFIQ